jgi:hypothetical protein
LASGERRWKGIARRLVTVEQLGQSVPLGFEHRQMASLRDLPFELGRQAAVDTHVGILFRGQRDRLLREPCTRSKQRKQITLTERRKAKAIWYFARFSAAPA